MLYRINSCTLCVFIFDSVFNKSKKILLEIIFFYFTMCKTLQVNFLPSQSSIKIVSNFYVQELLQLRKGPLKMEIQ